MSSVPKLGNNRYLATSKGVNRMLNQLNGILAADNITVQNVTANASNVVNITLANGNFVNITLPASGTYTFYITDLIKGQFYLLIKQPAAGNAVLQTGTNPITCLGTYYRGNGISPILSPGGSTLDMLTFTGDGLNYYHNLTLKLLS